MKSYKIITTLLIILYFYEVGFTAHEPVQLRNREPFLIAPMIEGIDMCEEAIQKNIRNSTLALKYCSENKFYNTQRLSNLLDSFEPQRLKGNVIVGYTYGVSLLGLYKKLQNGQWEVNQQYIDKVITQITRMDRPVVLYLMSDHFDTSSDLAIELSEDSNNLMTFQNGNTPSEGYFQNSIIAFTLNDDESIPVNQYRFNAIRAISKSLLKMPKKHFKKIRAITLNGETHHLFKGFFAGPAFNKPYFITDYSARSIKNFQIWLENRFINITDLNTVVNQPYLKFEDIRPPSLDINANNNAQPYEHIDAYADGFIPISGWIWDKEKVIKEILVAVDGTILGKVERNFNRLDVFQTVESITDPNVGFLYKLNFSNITAGEHGINLIAKDIYGRYFQMGSKTITIKKGLGAPIVSTTVAKKYPLLCETIKKDQCCINIEAEQPSDLNIRYWVDSFGYDDVNFTYNKLNSLWLEYREYQVSKFMKTYFNVAEKSGIPSELLFSHQILSGANSDWDYNMLGANDSIQGEHQYNIGVNLYAGSQFTKSFKKLMTHHTKKVGIPEYHPQQHKDRQFIDHALYDLYDSGVDFVTPYYISLFPDSMRGKTDHNKFLIQENNTEYGSNLFYKSIIDFAKN